MTADAVICVHLCESVANSCGGGFIGVNRTPERPEWFDGRWPDTLSTVEGPTRKLLWAAFLVESGGLGEKQIPRILGMTADAVICVHLCESVANSCGGGFIGVNRMLSAAKMLFLG
jgi:hypothetical protein